MRMEQMGPRDFIVAVGVAGIEPAAFASQRRRATKLRYTP